MNPRDKNRKLNDLIRALREIGLTETQARVYAFLLREGTSTAKKAALETKIPVERIYRTFEQLHELGLIKYEGSRPIRYSPVSPESAIKGLYVKKSLELEERFQRLFECMGFVSELVSLSQWTKEDVLIIKEAYLFLGLLKDMLRAAESEFLAIFSVEDRWLFKEIISLVRYLQISNVRMMLPSTDWISGYAYFKGFEMRISKSNVSGLLIDRKQAVLAGRKGDSPLIVVILEESILDPFIQYLESKWIAAIPVEVGLGRRCEDGR